MMTVSSVKYWGGAFFYIFLKKYLKKFESF